MKFSSKVQKCQLSPIRKFHPYAVAAKAAGKKVYHLNIGQPDVITPPQFFEAVRNFDQPVLEYAPSPGIPELIEAIQKYYDNLGMHFETDEIQITNGGSEALQLVLNCILEDGDEILIPEPYYPNSTRWSSPSAQRSAPSRQALRRVTTTLTVPRLRHASTSVPVRSCAPTPATPPA